MLPLVFLTELESELGEGEHIPAMPDQESSDGIALAELVDLRETMAKPVC